MKRHAREVKIRQAAARLFPHGKTCEVFDPPHECSCGAIAKRRAWREGKDENGILRS